MVGTLTITKDQLIFEPNLDDAYVTKNGVLPYQLYIPMNEIFDCQVNRQCSTKVTAVDYQRKPKFFIRWYFGNIAIHQYIRSNFWPHSGQQKVVFWWNNLLIICVDYVLFIWSWWLGFLKIRRRRLNQTSHYFQLVVCVSKFLLWFFEEDHFGARSSLAAFLPKLDQPSTFLNDTTLELVFL